MSLLIGWITNLIVFVLFAAVLDMLLPTSSVQKYTKFVIGLMLIAIFIAPLLSIFNKDFVKDVEGKILESEIWKNKGIENSVEIKKREIEEKQHAYILEHMAVQLENKAEKELMDKHHSMITQLSIELVDDQGEVKEDNIKQIQVKVEKAAGTQSKSIMPVEEVNIDLNQTERKSSELSPQIQDTLAEIWGLDKEKIIIGYGKGGEGI